MATEKNIERLLGVINNRVTMNNKLIEKMQLEIRNFKFLVVLQMLIIWSLIIGMIVLSNI